MQGTRHVGESPLTDEESLTEEFLNSLFHTSAFTVSYRKGDHIPLHNHRHGQLIRPLTGAVRVNASNDIWLVMVGQALWLHPGTQHSIDVSTASLVQFVYVNFGLLGARVPANGRIDVPPLLNGILDELRAMPSHYKEGGPIDRLTAVMLDQVIHADSRRQLAECPGDRRLALIYQMMVKDPSNRRSLKQLAQATGVSTRTVARLLLTHCSMTFREWRERVILGLALNRLKYGGRITDVALDLGYSSTSAFISAFRRRTDMTPKQWVAKSLADRSASSPVGPNDV
jgi:AraC-like DNA-binding protein/quercetin dioxygenase-like cupin family protein